MSSKILLSHLESGSAKPSLNSGLATYPPDPLPLIREGEGYLKRGASPLLNTPGFLTRIRMATRERGQGLLDSKVSYLLDTPGFLTRIRMANREGGQGLLDSGVSYLLDTPGFLTRVRMATRERG